MNIKNQAVLVAGGASGMGEAVCHRIAQLGAHPLVLDHHGKRAEAVAEATGGSSYVCDVSSAKGLEETFQGIPEKYKKVLKVVVNCAGIAPAKRMVGREGPVSLDWFENVVKVNLIGTFNVMRLAADLMIKHASDEATENGVIINTASIAAFEGQIGQTAYSASKGGVVSLTLPLARELAQFKIRVMAIAPGMIETPMLQGMPDNVRDALLNDTVFPKRFGAPQEYASLVQQIIENPMLNGSVIRMDGAVRMSA